MNYYNERNIKLEEENLDREIKNTGEDYIFKSQQYSQRNPQIPPREPIGTPPGAPSSAPPNFTPDMQRGGGQQFYGPQGEGFSRGGQGQYGNFRGCLNRFTYMWLINGNDFWFYPTFIGRQQVEGFRWRNGRWMYARINIRRILFFRCF